jgi:AcrR family transcriptional regulator
MASGQPAHANVAAMARLREEHVGATRAALLAAARARFGEVGFAATSLDDVVAAAGVTKGALYHHFTNKEHLFLEVYDQVEGELSAEGSEAVVGATTVVEAMQRAFGAFLDRSLEPEIRRIAILDAPAVLGPEAKLEVDRRHSLAGVAGALVAGMDAGELVVHDPEVLAQLLIAACLQAALLIAQADDHVAARKQIGAALDDLLAGLAAKPKPKSKPATAPGRSSARRGR